VSFSCGSQITSMNQEQVPGPKALIYKTKADYFDKVPIALSADKTQVVSFPDPGDLKRGDKLMLPDRLIRSYLLDNKGIGPNTAFLKYTYSEYAALKQVPDPNQLMELILDDDPMIEIWECGMLSDFENTKELKQIIRSKFKDCTKLK